MSNFDCEVLIVGAGPAGMAAALAPWENRPAMAWVRGLYDLHRGALAAMQRPELPTVADLLHGARRVVVVEDVGEIQVADVPGRCEPGTGEINYPAIARALADVGARSPAGRRTCVSSWPAAAWRARA